MASTNGDGDEDASKDKSLCNRKRVSIVLVLLLVVVALVADQIAKPCMGKPSKASELTCNTTSASASPTASPTRNPQNIEQACVTAALNAFVDWLEENTVAGSFAYIVVYALATILFIPGSILTIGAGAAFTSALDNSVGWGLLIGTLVVFVGAMLGSIIQFYLGRYVLQSWVASQLSRYRILRAIDASIEKDGLRIIALLRLSPIIPFNVFGYAVGGTSVSFRDFVLGSLFILPGTAAFVFLGTAIATATASDCTSQTDKTVRLVVLIVGVVAAIVAVALVGKKTKRVLDGIVD